MGVWDIPLVSSGGNRYLLLVAERASRFLLPYPLESKGFVSVAKKILEPLSNRSDAG